MISVAGNTAAPLLRQFSRPFLSRRLEVSSQGGVHNL